jgi:oligoribonuclease NrnB/cAMP/cGMP phosphodiesterase (DHH superfamily)
LPPSLLAEICDPTSIIDMKRCAAEIVWVALHGKEASVPWFLKHVRDRDLWRWDHKDSKAFSAAFYNDGYTFATLDAYVKMDQSQIHALYAKGAKLLEVESAVVTKLCGTATVCDMLLGDSKVRVILVESQICVSEIGHALLALHPEIHVAAIAHFSLSTKCWKISLRSRPVGNEKHVNVATVASRFFEGGGHPPAAAFLFRFPLDKLFQPVA